MQANEEIRVKGRAVSRGVAQGKVLCLYGTRRQFFRRDISESHIPNELQKLEHAFSTACSSIDTEIEGSLAAWGPAVTEILETHRTMLADPLFRTEIRNTILTEKVNAEWAVLTVSDELSSRLSKHTEPHLREKILDIEDVCDRLLKGLGLEDSDADIAPNTVIAAREVSPSMLLSLSGKGIVGIISESGGWTSHTSILARELGIPAVTGITNIFRQFKNGMSVIVDGDKGEVAKQPIDKVFHDRYLVNDRPQPRPDSVTPPFHFSTLDGRRITIRTNTTSVAAYLKARDLGARGIGLYRSESLIDTNGTIPDEDHQAANYSEIAEAVGEDGVRIRTFDLDAAQFQPTISLRQKNPALGLRAVRLGIANSDLIKPQVRALLRASVGKRIGLVVPMVSGVPDIEAVKRIVASESADLKRLNVPHGELEFGAMIEVPSSVFVADQLLKVCDFLCLGTNDLAQYLLAADRDNVSVSSWFRTLHPSMLRAVRHVIDECRNADKPLTVCGEMAGSPFYVPVLLGLGATELSMNPNSIEAVSKMIMGINHADTLELVNTIEDVPDPDEIELKVTETCRDRWAHLLPPGFLDRQNP